MSELRKMDEKELREFKLPKIRTIQELDAIIAQLVEREHDYGTCVYAMSIAAHATFEYVACKLGVTGFQASCADMDIITRIRKLKRFQIVTFDNLIYPQDCTTEHFPDYKTAIQKNAKWLKKEAQQKLNGDISTVNKDVVAHWKMLAALTPTPDKGEMEKKSKQKNRS